MKYSRPFFLAIVAFSFFLGACNSGNKKTEILTPKEVENLDLVKKPSSWVSERVNKAKEQLNASEAGKIVWQSMDAHGSLKQWFENGALAFRFDYIPVNKGIKRKTYQKVDTWNNRAIHHSIKDNEDTFGWDGKAAWIKRNDTNQFAYDVRFWALTPYYFLGQPFIFDGQGVILEKLEDRVYEAKEYDVVKVSFEAGTGDAPDDYYINYYDKETHLLKVIRYIVSYPSYFKDGGHSPEKMMVAKNYTTVSGITFPNSYATYSLTSDTGEIDEKVTDITVSEISFDETLPIDFFNMPEDAVEAK